MLCFAGCRGAGAPEWRPCRPSPCRLATLTTGVWVSFEHGQQSTSSSHAYFKRQGKRTGTTWKLLDVKDAHPITVAIEPLSDVPRRNRINTVNRVSILHVCAPHPS